MGVPLSPANFPRPLQPVLPGTLAPLPCLERPSSLEHPSPLGTPATLGGLAGHCTAIWLSLWLTGYAMCVQKQGHWDMSQ